MSEKEYIVDLIEDAIRLFTELTIRYEFKESSASHIIEVTPKRVFESPSFHRFMEDKIFAFYDQFPNTSIVFITEGSLTEIVEPEIARSNSPAFVCFDEHESFLSLGWLTLEDSAKWIRVIGTYQPPAPDIDGIIFVNPEEALGGEYEGLHIDRLHRIDSIDFRFDADSDLVNLTPASERPHGFFSGLVSRKRKSDSVTYHYANAA